MNEKSEDDREEEKEEKKRNKRVTGKSKSKAVMKGLDDCLHEKMT